MALWNRPLTFRPRPVRRRSTAMIAAGVGMALLAACTSGSDDAASSTPTASTSATTTGAGSSAAGPSTAAGIATTDSTVPEPSGAPAPGEVTSISAQQLQAGLDRVDGFVQAEMAATGVPGVAVAVVHDDQVALAKGYGVRELGKADAVDPQTVFQLASLSKALSSTGIAALVGKGTIAWTDPVTRYNPDLQFSDDYVTRNVTFADLYSHRSGLPSNAGNFLEFLGYDRQQIFDRFKDIPLNPFRVTYGYSNFGMTAAGDAAAKAAGVPFDQLMTQQLFGPAGMTTASASYDEFLARPDRTSLHARVNGTWGLGPVRDPDAQAPAGGISASVDDMARWVRLTLNGGTIDGQQVVDPAALEATHTPQILRKPLATPESAGEFYGLGWNLEVDHLGQNRWSHSGAFTNGAGTTVVLLPELNLGVVVLTNGSPIGAAETIADDVVDTIVTGQPTTDWSAYWTKAFAPLSTPDEKLSTPPANAQPALPNSAYVGTYANDFYGSNEVVEENGTLQLIAGPAKVKLPLTHYDGNTFTYAPQPGLPNVPAPLTFAVGADGTVTSVDIIGFDAPGSGLGVLNRVS